MGKTVLPDGFQAYFDAWEAKIGAFLEYCVSSPPSGAPSGELSGSLSGLPCAVKDNIAVSGFGLTCGSRLLKDFKSSYTATAVARLQAQGAWVMGKTNLDEFGMGSSTDDSALKRTNNPWDISRVAGGSSGGSAAAVAAGLVPFALGSDTGGSVRQPAAFCGVVGLKPTYGAVSRFGLVAYASSLETIGIIGDTVSRVRNVFSIIRGVDPLDQTTVSVPDGAASLQAPAFRTPGPDSDPNAPRTIGVLSPESVARTIAGIPAAGNVAAGIVAAGPSAGGTLAGSGDDEAAEAARAAESASQAAMLEDEVAQAFELAKERLRGLGHTLVEVELPSLVYGVPAYYTIATAEASANLARFDGIRYGQRPAYAENPDDLVSASREAGLGPEVKLRILLGTFVLRSGFQDRYYLRAQRIRDGIRRDFEGLLGVPGQARSPRADQTARPACDAILMPVFPTRAFGRGDAGLSPFAQKAADIYTCCANLAGLPALAFPVGVAGGLPTAVQLVGRAFSEGMLLDVAEGYHAVHPAPRPAGYRAMWS